MSKFLFIYIFSIKLEVVHIISVIYFLFLLDRFFYTLLILLTFSSSFLEHYISSLSQRWSFHCYRIDIYVTLASIHEFFFLEENIHEIKSYSKVCSHKHSLTLSHTISLYCSSITCTTHIDHQRLCMCKHDI